MFNSPILDLAIALCFTYFVLSLMVSTVHEFIYSILGSKRSKYLKEAIEELFYDSHWKKLAAKLYDDSNIEALKGKSKKEPSYIPSRNFALALLEQFRDGNNTLDMTQINAVLQDDTKAANKGIDGCIRKTLIAFYERAENDLKKFQEQVETFYNDAMDRASGTYKRSTRKVILVISLVLATALNADTVHIAKTLWENPSALKKTADNIQSAVKNIHKDQNGNFVIDSVSSNGDQLQIEMMRTDTTNAPDTVRGVTRLIKHEGGKAVPVQTDTVKEIKKIKEVMKTQVVYLQHSGIPLGWTKDNMPSGSCKEKAVAWAYKIFGLLLTACALLLGAPFWFDLINKFINVRGTGKKPEEAEDNGDAKKH